MNLRNRYYRYFCEMSSMVGISEYELAQKIISLDIGEKIVTQNYIIRLKQRTESHEQTLPHLCLRKYWQIGPQ